MADGTKEDEARRWVRKRERKEREESSKALQRRGGNATGGDAGSSYLALTHAHARASTAWPSYKDMERHLSVVCGRLGVGLDV